MSRVRDLFFDEFYEELESVVSGIERDEEETEPVLLLRDEARRRWLPYAAKPEDRRETLISVDGGVQVSSFAYGDFVAVGRACALLTDPSWNGTIEKSVKIYIGKVYDERDRAFIPSYVRMIAEYSAAKAAAERVLERGGKPLVLMDGTLYVSRFPYALHEYQHHPELLAELFASINELHTLGRERGIPVVAVAKDSMVFYMYMALLRELAMRTGLDRHAKLIDEASSPLDLRLKLARCAPETREDLKGIVEERPLCDLALIRESTAEEGYTTPLLLAPSIYFSRDEAPALYRRLKRSIDTEQADRVIGALKAFFSSSGVASLYWKPTRKAAPIRVDVAASVLGDFDPWERRRRNTFVEEGCDLSVIEGILNHLGHWFCNEVEYNLPLHQADRLARFDHGLYSSKYEPFIISRLEQAGLDVTGRRRTLREA